MTMMLGPVEGGAGRRGRRAEATPARGGRGERSRRDARPRPRPTADGRATARRRGRRARRRRGSQADGAGARATPTAAAEAEPPPTRSEPTAAAAAERRRRRCSGAGPAAAMPSAILAPSAMPKMKTHSGAKKRFKLTAKGKVRGRHAFTSHILEKKSPKRKRHLGNPRRSPKPMTPARQEAAGSGAPSDPRQALRPRPQEAPRDPRARQGLPRRGATRTTSAPRKRCMKADSYALPRPPQPQARLPPPVDHPHQRRRAPERHDLRARSCTASSWPASSWTARCWPTSPCATPRPSADLPSAAREASAAAA